MTPPTSRSYEHTLFFEGSKVRTSPSLRIFGVGLRTFKIGGSSALISRQFLNPWGVVEKFCYPAHSERGLRSKFSKRPQKPLEPKNPKNSKNLKTTGKRASLAGRGRSRAVLAGYSERQKFQERGRRRDFPWQF